jgi:hypothetical protein
MEALRSTASKKAGLPRAGLSRQRTIGSMATRHLHLHIQRQWCESGSALFCRIRIDIQGMTIRIYWFETAGMGQNRT